MKGTLFFMVFLAMFIAWPGGAYCDSMDELVEQFGKEYEAMKPPPNSSVNSDYKLDQVALGALYTTKTLSLIYKQNQIIMEKYDQLVMRYEKIITQNKEMIRLLSIIAKK